MAYATPHVAVDIYDYERNKVCSLYDSSQDSPGQAHNITHVNELNGWQELSFTMPYVLDNEEYNFRWDYIKNEYKVCLTVGDTREWFFIQTPKKRRDSKEISNTVKCTAECGILKTKNIYAQFDDENGIGTLSELAEKVLQGTGWTLGYCDTPLEKDGMTEKIRSLKSSGKAGAYKQITTLCDLFKVYPIFDGDAHTVSFYGYELRDHLYEGMVGGASAEGANTVRTEEEAAILGRGVIGLMIIGYRDPMHTGGSYLKEGDIADSAYGLTAISSELDSTDIVTRLYVEGEYAEDGYVGIDDAEDNPTGLTYILNFDYYKEVGLFGASHQAALDTYLEDMPACVQSIRQHSASIAEKSNECNTLWGQWNFVEYVLENGNIVRTHYSGIATEEEHGQIEEGDILIIVSRSGDEQTGYEYHYRKVTVDSQFAWQSSDEYAVKLILANAQWQEEDWFEEQYYRAAGQIGAKEVAIEAKEKVIEDLDREIAIVEAVIEDLIEHGIPVPQARYDELHRYQNEKAAAQADIQLIYEGSEGDEETAPVIGLYELYYKAMKAFDELDVLQKELEELQEEQTEIEDAFIVAMGDMLKDGYWSNTNYILGQENELYADAVEQLEKMSRPSVKYTVDREVLSSHQGYKVNNFRINGNIRLYDPYLGINDLVYITKITKTYDAPWEDKVDISNEKDIVISGKNLSSTLSRISSVASNMEQNQSLYERAKAINSSGNIYVERLEGAIDVQKTRLQAAVSSWYTDDNGNIMFVSADGQSAMMLCGEGFMIAPDRNDDGSWNWRTFGTGKGFTADMIITGFLSADVIKAGTITVNKLASDVGESLDLSSNTSIHMIVSDLEEEIIDEINVGGRNLIHNTLYPDTEDPMTINGLAEGSILYSEGDIESTPHGTKITVADGVGTIIAAPVIAFGSQDTTTLLGLTAGNTYTFSFDASAKLLSNNTNNTTYYLYAKLYHDGESAGVFAEGSSYTIFEYPLADKGTEKSGKVKWTFEIPSTANKLYIKIYTGDESGTAVSASSFATGDYIQLDNIRLESGNEGTDWTPAPEDYQQVIGETQSALDATQTQLEQYQATTWTEFDAVRDSISMSVNTAKVYTDNKTADVMTSVTKLNLKTSDIEASVQSLYDGLGTHVIIEPEMVRVTQDQNENCEMQLYADRMDFVNTNGDVTASFGVDGAYTDRLRSNKTLSVGTDGENGYGWFDFTMMATGMAEKWRSTDGFEYTLHITKHPVTTSGTMSVEALGNGLLTYQWKYSPDNGASWANVSTGGNVATYTPGISFPRDALYLYRCVVTDGASDTAISESARVFSTTAPVIAFTSEDVSGGTTTYKATAVGTDALTTYQWYVLNEQNNTWDTISGETTDSFSPSSSGQYVCVVGGNGSYNASQVFDYESA